MIPLNTIAIFLTGKELNGDNFIDVFELGSEINIKLLDLILQNIQDLDFEVIDKIGEQSDKIIEILDSISEEQLESTEEMQKFTEELVSLYQLQNQYFSQILNTSKELLSNKEFENVPQLFNEFYKLNLDLLFETASPEIQESISEKIEKDSSVFEEIKEDLIALDMANALGMPLEEVVEYLFQDSLGIEVSEDKFKNRIKELEDSEESDNNEDTDSQQSPGKKPVKLDLVKKV